MPTIHDIAQAAGVSAATVSRAFRSPDKLNADALERVLAAARELGYEPRSQKARGATGAPERRTIAFQFFADRPADMLVANPFYAPVLYGAMTEAAHLGLNLVVHTADRHRKSGDVERQVADWGLDGMLLVGGIPDPSIADLYARHVPHIVLLDNRDVAGRFDCVTSDGFGGGLQATRHLLALGHRRIGFLLPEAGVEPFEERLRGYLWALRAAGVADDHALTATLEYDMPDDLWRERLQALLRQPDRPTAVVTANDDTAFALLRQCREWGIRVPDELSVVGFDDMPTAALLDPPLTTLRVEKEFLGRLGVRRLHGRLRADPDTQPTEPTVQHTVSVNLIVRGSSAPPPNA